MSPFCPIRLPTHPLRTLQQLENSISTVTSDLRYANSMIQADLDRFQRQKVSDFREMCLSFSNLHKDWCTKNLEMWSEAKRLVDDIDDTPAPLLNPSLGPGAGVRA